MTLPESVAGLPANAAPTSAPQESEPEVTLNVPLVTDATEATFNDVVSTSRAVPVVILLWSSRTLESREAITTLEDLAREMSGRFQLVKIDADTSPDIVRAFQVQALPTVVALVGGRPIPLFQGVAAKEQIRPVFEELLQAAAQMGVTARVAVAEEDIAEPIPDEHLPAMALEEEGDLEGARAAWEKVVNLNPRDEKAKTELARISLLLRSAEADSSDPHGQADALFASGDHAAAFDLLLGAMAQTTDSDERDALRTRLLDLFRIAGSTDEVKVARKRLTTLLMI
ncbi:MAG: tetratricopeptide repeat protein [Actinomycetaceae bacterium]|nr:tetratricopeptide repeat protein [Actinomycetaceae bacterium]